MRGKKTQKIMSIFVIALFLVPSMYCMSINQEKEEGLTLKNPLTQQIVYDIVVNEDILLVQDRYDNYIFDITNKDNPKKRVIIDSSTRNFIKNFIHKNKLLTYISYNDNGNIKYELQIYDLTDLRNPKLVESIPIEGILNNYPHSYQLISEEEEVIIYHLDYNGTKVYQERINMNTYEYQCQMNTTEELFEEKGMLYSIMERENKVYLAYADENNTLALGIFTIQEDYKLVKDKIMKSNDTVSTHWLDFIVDDNYFVTKMDVWATGFGSKQHVYDLTNGNNLTKICELEYQDIGSIVAIRNNYVYTLHSTNLSIYEITDWENRELIGTCQCDYILFNGVIKDNYAYVNQGSYWRTNYLVVIDITNKQEMEIVKIFGTQLVKSETQFIIMAVASWIGLITGIVAIILTPILIIRRRKKTKKKIKELETIVGRETKAKKIN